MSDFNPVTLYHILYEGMGAWLWLLLALGLALLAGIVNGFIRLRRAGRPAKRPLTAALVAGLVTALVFTFLVPMWSLAGPGAFNAALDYVAAFVFALVPGAIVGSAVFVMAAMRCSAKAAPTLG